MVLHLLLPGTNRNGQAHLLVSTENAVLQRSDVNVFLIRDDRDIGDVKGVRFWHDNTGTHPSW